MRHIALLLLASVLAGCGSIYTVLIPLGDGQPPLPTAAITIDDQRPAAAREVHTGGGLGRCERWYGDDSYVPAKLDYLRQLLSARAPESASLSLTLRSFDTIEYCDNTAQRAGAAAAAGASGALGSAVYTPSAHIPGGDSVLVRVTGEINGVPFDLSRHFDYEDLPYNTLTALPSANPTYRKRMTRALEEIADELVALSRRTPI